MDVRELGFVSKSIEANLPGSPQNVIADEKVVVGISACLVGDEVRFNAGHKKSSICMDTLSSYFSYRKFCPEVAAGMGVPRPMLRLEGDPERPGLFYRPGQKKSLNLGDDFSTKLILGFKSLLPTIGELDGYILMQNSPSCGVDGVKVFHHAEGEHGGWHVGRGIFSRAVMEAYPFLPIEEEGRLSDPSLLESFVSRVYAYRRFRALDSKSFADLVEFHGRCKYLLMAHSDLACGSMGQLLSKRDKVDPQAQRVEYLGQLMTALAIPVGRKGHANALMHMLGCLGGECLSVTIQDIARSIDQYRLGHISLASVVEEFRCYLERSGNDYIKGQYYLNPYPDELGLRNEI